MEMTIASFNLNWILLVVEKVHSLMEEFNKQERNIRYLFY